MIGDYVSRVNLRLYGPDVTQRAELAVNFPRYRKVNGMVEGKRPKARQTKICYFVLKIEGFCASDEDSRSA